MDLRDQFAMKALEIIYSDSDVHMEWRKGVSEDRWTDSYASFVAFLAYDLADEMMTARMHEESENTMPPPPEPPPPRIIREGMSTQCFGK